MKKTKTILKVESEQFKLWEIEDTPYSIIKLDTENVYKLTIGNTVLSDFNSFELAEKSSTILDSYRMMQLAEVVYNNIKLREQTNNI